MSRKRFETTYTRDFCLQVANIWRNYEEDSGISSEDESHDKVKDIVNRNKSQCFCTKRASNYDYIHHINPTEHLSRYDNTGCPKNMRRKSKKRTQYNEVLKAPDNVRGSSFPVDQVTDWIHHLNLQIVNSRKVLEISEKVLLSTIQSTTDCCQ